MPRPAVVPAARPRVTTSNSLYADPNLCASPSDLRGAVAAKSRAAPLVCALNPPSIGERRMHEELWG